MLVRECYTPSRSSVAVSIVRASFVRKRPPLLINARRDGGDSGGPFCHLSEVTQDHFRLSVLQRCDGNDYTNGVMTWSEGFIVMAFFSSNLYCIREEDLSAHQRLST